MLQVLRTAIASCIDKKGLKAYKSLEKELVRLARGQELLNDVTTNQENLVARLRQLGATLAYRPGN